MRPSSVEGDHVAVGGRYRPQEARQAQRQLAHEGVVRHRIGGGRARLGQAQPDAAVHAARQVVRKAGQAVEHDVGAGARRRGGRRVRARPRSMRHIAVGAGFGDEQRSLICGQNNAIREGQAIHHDLDPPAGCGSASTRPVGRCSR
jgi:hypothetical protein